MTWLPPFVTVAQHETIMVDTVEVYRVESTLVVGAGPTLYLVDGKSVTKAEYERVTVGILRSEGCSPCFLRLLTLEDVLLETGLYYHICPSATKLPLHQSSDATTEDSTLVDRSCRHGRWESYNTSGNVTAIVYYDHGKKVKKPRRKK